MAAPMPLPAPVISSPADGEIITGSPVTFAGTGEPGAEVPAVSVDGRTWLDPRPVAPDVTGELVELEIEGLGRQRQTFGAA